MRVRIRCPDCAKSIQATPADAGRWVMCGACGGRALVPAGLAPTPPWQPELVVAEPAPLRGLGDGPSGVAAEFAPAAGLEDAPQVDWITPPSAAAVRPISAADEPTAGAAWPGTASGAAAVASKRHVRAAARGRLPAAVVAGGLFAGAVLSGLLIGRALPGRDAATPGPGGTAAPGGAAGSEAGPAAGAGGGSDAAFPDLVRAKAAADALLADGRYAAAQEAYWRLAAAAQDHGSPGPQTAALLTAAAAAEVRAGQLLRQFGDGAARPAAGQQPPVAEATAAAAGLGVAGGGLAAPDAAPAAGGSPAVGSPPEASAEMAASAASAAPAAASSAAGRTPASQPATVVAAAGPLSPGNLPATAPVDAPATLDDRVGVAIARGADFLAKQFTAGELPAERGPTDEIKRRGLHALCAYALLAAGQAADDPRLNPRSPFMAALIDKLKGYALDSRYDLPAQPVVYARSLRAAALALHNRAEDRGALREDVRWLVAAAIGGAYSYDDRYSNPASRRYDTGQAAFSMYPPAGGQGLGANGLLYRVGPGGVAIHICHPTRAQAMTMVLPLPMGSYADAPDGYRRFPWDNGNSQYGLMGVAAGAEAGVVVPARYWAEVTQHWTASRLPDDAWPLMTRDNVGRASMTSGAVASLLAAYDVGRRSDTLLAAAYEPPSAAVDAGLAWLAAGGRGLRAPNPQTMYVGYDLFSLTRAALASGTKYLGDRDWYADAAGRLTAAQRADGSWAGGGNRPAGVGADPVIETAYAVLSLSLGRHPLLMNKLRYDARPPTHPRDVANLCRYVGRQLERPVNWRAADLRRPDDDWLDAPILYVAGDAAPRLRAAEYARLKAYVGRGGVLFLHADGGSRAFNDWVPELVARVCPGGALADLPADHPVLAGVRGLKSPPRLRAVSVGGRLAVVHSPTDLARAWDERAVDARPAAFRVALDLYAHVTHKGGRRNRLAPPPSPAESREVGAAQEP